jgi:hypothetical protein
MEGYAGYAMLIVYLGKDFLLMILTLTKMVSPINTDGDKSDVSISRLDIFRQA